MSYYFKLLSNIPGCGTSWSYSAQFKSTQDEAKEAEIWKKRKKKRRNVGPYLQYFCDKQFLKIPKHELFKAQGVCSGLCYLIL